ncbi:Uncharacterised protein [Rhodococcus erythropolis]|uniref:hypothetical protein n=1 Tax=Rhodococcus erythropolis TaxID=1833 RepID=UPI000DFC76A9|nr:hypothetical protein [Rhodococcus erythropolis]SUH12188.1 Uncharacterised protein [Rhodococcus erythropolis]
MNNETTTIVAPAAKAGAASAVAAFVLGTLIGWLFFPDAMKPAVPDPECIAGVLR